MYLHKIILKSVPRATLGSTKDAARGWAPLPPKPQVLTMAALTTHPHPVGMDGRKHSRSNLDKILQRLNATRTSNSSSITVNSQMYMTRALP